MKEKLLDYERIRDRILCRLVSAERSGQLPENVVYVSYLDLSVIFCVFLEGPERGMMREFKITREMLQRWDISTEQVIRDAFDNTRRRYRYIFRDLGLVTEAVSEQADRFFIDPAGVIESVPEGVSGREGGGLSGMYTLVNQELFNGSVILLFPDQLKVFAEQTGTDLVLLPSSVNELICLEKRDDLDYGRLRSIVMSVNRTCVSEEEILSDQLYQYVRIENRVELLLE